MRSIRHLIPVLALAALAAPAAGGGSDELSCDGAKVADLFEKMLRREAPSFENERCTAPECAQGCTEKCVAMTAKYRSMVALDPMVYYAYAIGQNRELWDAILNEKYVAGYQDVRPINIQMIIHDGGSGLNQKVGMTKGIAAHRKVEFVVTSNFVPNTNAMYSDLVLPVTTQWERAGYLKGNREHLIWARNITAPPSGVYLMAFVTRLSSISRMRRRSAITHTG